MKNRIKIIEILFRKCYISLSSKKIKRRILHEEDKKFV